jgi:lipopolysaccharide biosynthesis regulator YciM
VAFAVQLRTVRASLLQLAQDRGSAQAALAQLEMFARRNNDQPREVARELAEQRMGLGAAYAELATDALKAGDKDRARRLLATAAHLDPGNRTRYEKQLQSFEPSGRLPAAAPESAGSAGEGAQR